MIRVLSTNITSPLGYTTDQNFRSVREGRASLRRMEHWRDIPNSFVASAFSDSQMEELMLEGYTKFESLVIRSVSEAMSRTQIDMDSHKTLFLLATTKADVDELGSEKGKDRFYQAPGKSARRIAEYFGIVTAPVVVCNACVSGAGAQVLAYRLLEAGYYDQAVVCGADCLTPFVVAGFMSLQSLSPEECRPFDIERRGLNIGEAAATIVYGCCDSPDEAKGRWTLMGGCLNSDAYHISSPSPVADGAVRAMEQVLKNVDKECLAFVNVHGTATLFNDQMESVAIEKTGLSDIPVMALKGFYGHTMGAAGVLETVLSLRALDEGIVLPVRGFEEIGVSGRITISNQEQRTGKHSFLKLISGFGGCNGALLFEKDSESREQRQRACSIDSAETHPIFDEISDSESREQRQRACSIFRPEKDIRLLKSVHLTDSFLKVDGEEKSVDAQGKAMLKELYKQSGLDYPKFYKMDVFSRMVFIASDLLVKGIVLPEAEKRMIVLFNQSSSVVQDRKHIGTIGGNGGFFPSPSVYIYTLPNIAVGEVAIKQGFKGETSLYILDERDDALMEQIVRTAFYESGPSVMITGWVDCAEEDVFEADLKLLTV